jgi:hypothetical protein
MDDVMVIVAVIGARRCGGSAHYRSHAAANRRTDTGTMPAARDCPDHSSSPRPEQTPPIARSAGLYGSAKAVVKIRPTPIRLAMVEYFLICSNPNARAGNSNSTW